MQARYESRLTQPALADRLMTLKGTAPRRVYGGHVAGGGRQLAVVGESLPHLQCGQSLSGLCRSELALFRRLLAPAEVERGAVSAGGDSRCLYRIRPPRP